MKIQLELPWWVSTVAGVLLIGVASLTATSIAQARLIDRLYTRIAVLDSEIDVAAVDHAKVESLEAAFDCLTKQQDLLTAATRSGWGQAHRLVRAGALETCVEDQDRENKTSD